MLKKYCFYYNRLMARPIEKIALINPKRPLKYENKGIYEMFERNRNQLKPWLGPPLNLLTIAALTPGDIEVKVIDEHYETIDFEQKYDLIGLTAMTRQADRAYEIAREFKVRNIPVVMGGIHASFLPGEALKHVDTAFVGEAEELWTTYLSDLKNGNQQRVYRSEKHCDLSKSPVPRYDLINSQAFNDVSRYFNLIPVQATRGCPHNCNFCAVSELYGKKVRKKNIDQVISEIYFLRKYFNNSIILFADDNLFVDKQYAKELLRELIPLKIKYLAQSDIKVAENDKLLELAYLSGCQIIFIGFESTNMNSLGEINENKWKLKHAESYSENIRKIQEKGIVVFGAFAIGFDNDGPGTFQEIRNFAVANNIPGQFTVLTPVPGSRLYNQLLAEDRLYEETFWNSCGFYNLVFRHSKLDRKEVEKSLIWLYDQVFSPENSLKRALCMKEIYKKLPQRWTYPEKIKKIS
jgi:radical SAM superfamily enzyme YgiQ (UPF0313 family)